MGSPAQLGQRWAQLPGPPWGLGSPKDHPTPGTAWGVTSRGTLKSHVECIIEVDMATQLSSLETHVIITENSENAEKHVK